MASGTKIRTLARQLDASSAVLWVIDSRGLLIYLSAGAASWLGVDGESLIKRRAVAGVPASEDPLDRLAAALSPPAGLQERGWVSLTVAPPSRGEPVAELDVRFARIGASASPLVFAFAGDFADPESSDELAEVSAIRQILDRWRKRDAAFAAIATAGTSSAARRTRARLQIAAGIRAHVLFCGPAGCDAEAIAKRVHHLSANGEPLAVIDGPLMDAELLDASVMPLVSHLAENRNATATALVSGLDETPAEAQRRLADLLTSYPDQLRLLAASGSTPAELLDPLPHEDAQSRSASAETDRTRGPETADSDSPQGAGILGELIDLLSGLTVSIAPLASRVEDIPVIAAALVDARHATGEGTAERLSRQAIDALITYPWPGDFQELDAAIRHAIRTSAHHRISPEHLPLAIRSYRPSEQQASPTTTLQLEESLRRFERRLIDDALASAGGNRAEAARRLGISRAKLLRRLAEDSDA